MRTIKITSQFLLVLTFLTTTNSYSQSEKHITDINDMTKELKEKPGHLVIQRAIRNYDEPFIYHFDDNSGIERKIKVKDSEKMLDAEFEMIFNSSRRIFCDGSYTLRYDENDNQYIYFEDYTLCLDEEQIILLKDSGIDEERVRELFVNLQNKMVRIEDSPYYPEIRKGSRASGYNEVDRAIGEAVRDLFSMEDIEYPDKS